MGTSGLRRSAATEKPARPGRDRFRRQPMPVVTAGSDPGRRRLTEGFRERRMLTRTAIYEGTVRDGREEEFFRRVRDELEPFWRRFPGVTAVRVQRLVAKDADARPIAMILEMDFPDQAALDACLASPIRPESHAATEAVMRMFEGRFYHLVSEGRTLPPSH